MLQRRLLRGLVPFLTVFRRGFLFLIKLLIVDRSCRLIRFAFVGREQDEGRDD